MGAQNDFFSTVDRAAGLLTDATCACRAAVAGPLPVPHRQIMRRAIFKLEAAQHELWTARNSPWEVHAREMPRQLELL